MFVAISALIMILVVPFMILNLWRWEQMGKFFNKKKKVEEEKEKDIDVEDEDDSDDD